MDESQMDDATQFDKETEEQKLIEEIYERLREYADPFKALGCESRPTREELDTYRFHLKRMGYVIFRGSAEFDAFEELVDRRYKEAVAILEGSKDKSLAAAPIHVFFSSRRFIIINLLFFFGKWLLSLYGAIATLIAFGLGDLLVVEGSPLLIPASLLLFGIAIAIPTSLAYLGRRSIVLVSTLIALLPASAFSFAREAGWFPFLSKLTNLGNWLIPPVLGYAGAYIGLGYLRWLNVDSTWSAVCRQLRLNMGHFRRTNAPELGSGKPTPQLRLQKAFSGAPFFLAAVVAAGCFMSLCFGLASDLRTRARRAAAMQITAAHDRGKNQGMKLAAQASAAKVSVAEDALNQVKKRLKSEEARANRLESMLENRIEAVASTSAKEKESEASGLVASEPSSLGLNPDPSYDEETIDPKTRYPFVPYAEDPDVKDRRGSEGKLPVAQKPKIDPKVEMPKATAKPKVSTQPAWKGVDVSLCIDSNLRSYNDGCPTTYRHFKTYNDVPKGFCKVHVGEKAWRTIKLCATSLKKISKDCRWTETKHVSPDEYSRLGECASCTKSD